jgi:uncharacterized protein with FMN-binding domain
MRRVAPVIIATIIGLALLATFKTTPTGSAKKVAIGSPPHASSLPASTVPPLPRGTTSPTNTNPAPTTTTTPPASRTIDGQDVPNQYGDVKVRVVLNGSRIVDVQAVQLPFDHPRSAEISRQAEPYLRQEVLQAQSANIDVVSGATFTSYSYAQSLQSALDQAGI